MNLDAIIRAVQTKLGAAPDGKAGPQTWGAIYEKIVGALVPTPILGAVDARSEAVIETLLPPVRPYARSLIHLAKDNGIPVRAISGLRTYAEQQAIFDKHDGTTNAPAGYSNHNFGLAFDLGVFTDSGKYADDEMKAGRYDRHLLSRQYAALGPLGKGFGLTWGGDWKSIDDEPHFELHPPWAAAMSESEMLAQLRTRHTLGKDAFA